VLVSVSASLGLVRSINITYIEHIGLAKNTERSLKLGFYGGPCFRNGCHSLTDILENGVAFLGKEQLGFKLVCSPLIRENYIGNNDLQYLCSNNIVDLWSTYYACLQ
jgi:hypothetical protein